MRRAPIVNFGRLIDALPGWMCVVGGAVLLAMFVWTPQWLAGREIAWQRDLMQAQAEALVEQRDRYATFEAALAEGDPILLERLAFTELRQKRVGQQLLAPEADVLLARNTEFWPDDPSLAMQPTASATMPGSVHAWLRVPMPVVGQDIKPPAPIQSHLTRIVTGPLRLPALLFAVGVMAMGVLMQVRDRARLQDFQAPST